MYIFVTLHAFNFQIWNFTKRANKDYSWKTAFQVLCCIIFMQSSWTDTESTKTLGNCKEQLPSADRQPTVGQQLAGFIVWLLNQTSHVGWVLYMGFILTLRIFFPVVYDLPSFTETNFISI